MRAHAGRPPRRAAGSSSGALPASGGATRWPHPRTAQETVEQGSPITFRWPPGAGHGLAAGGGAPAPSNLVCYAVRTLGAPAILFPVRHRGVWRTANGTFSTGAATVRGNATVNFSAPVGTRFLVYSDGSPAVVTSVVVVAPTYATTLPQVVRTGDARLSGEAVLERTSDEQRGQQAAAAAPRAAVVALVLAAAAALILGVGVVITRVLIRTTAPQHHTFGSVPKGTARSPIAAARLKTTGGSPHSDGLDEIELYLTDTAATAATAANAANGDQGGSAGAGESSLWRRPWSETVSSVMHAFERRVSESSDALGAAMRQSFSRSNLSGVDPATQLEEAAEVKPLRAGTAGGGGDSDREPRGNKPTVARALLGCRAASYDKLALSFEQGEMIEVVHKHTDNGQWEGACHARARMRCALAPCLQSASFIFVSVLRPICFPTPHTPHPTPF